MAEKDWDKILSELNRKDANAARRYRRHSLSLDLMSDESISYQGEEKDGDTEVNRHLEAALSKLTWKQRRIIKLIYFEGYTQKEAAKILHCAYSSTNQLLKRAEKELSRLLK